ncbi:RNA methyltransferase [Bdellovibrio sp. HCB274]|uniref:RNA methyltransferase n=1 Tax=Bdellovibrio sp. HCB274 TaxID=3394361 RepID=UPI0039B5A207
MAENSTYVPRLAIGLVHYPVRDRQNKTVATNITNFDIHDIARAAQTFGVEKYYIIHPMKEQLMFVDRVLDHWRTGQGAKYNPMRKTALGSVKAIESVEKAIEDWNTPGTLLISTSAREEGLKKYSFSELRHEMHVEKKPVFMLFGTGNGMTTELLRSCSGVLESIRGAPPQDYRHLSVRSAVSICLDRVMGPW